MNTAMWDHIFTSRHLAVCTDELGYQIVPPVAKKLACGDIGVGAMAEVPTIVGAVVECVEKMVLTDDVSTDVVVAAAEAVENGLG
jgi:phosphopantothenoylcysteine decarboxylase